MPSNNKDLYKYLGLASQMMISISLFTYIGFRLDKYFRWPNISTIVLPLLFLIVIFYKIVKDTKPKK
jgi:uncharacterized membrane protein YhdT